MITYVIVYTREYDVVGDYFDSGAVIFAIPETNLTEEEKKLINAVLEMKTNKFGSVSTDRGYPHENQLYELFEKLREWEAQNKFVDVAQTYQFEGSVKFVNVYQWY